LISITSLEEGKSDEEIGQHPVFGAYFETFFFNFKNVFPGEIVRKEVMRIERLT